jgi:oxygen-independent coproporphyrinogen-3 oxidase
MYALPQQTLAQAEAGRAPRWKYAPRNVRYHLTLEPNTLFHRYPPSLPDDDAEQRDAQASRRCWRTAISTTKHRLRAAQKQSRHNLNCWRFGDYLGIGAGAHSKISSHDGVLGGAAAQAAAGLS